MSGNYKVGKLLGEGGFGKVFLIEDEDDPSVQNAMKIVQVSQMSEDEVKLTLQEIKLLSEMEHEHIVQYITCFQQDECLCIVTEFCPNGDLSEYIEKQRGEKLEEPRLIEWFRQIASAVEYVHSKNIIHRDLKVANVFLDKDMNCKLGDFGVARVLEGADAMAQTQAGTYHYMSPEIFMGIKYNSKTDIWSLAVMIYELAALEKPFDAYFLPMLILKITRGETPSVPDGYRPEFGALLLRMMEKDPDNRPTASEILHDNLFQQQKKPKPMPNLKTMDDWGSEDYDMTGFDPNQFLMTFSEMTVPGKKKGDKPKVPPKPKVLPKLAEENTKLKVETDEERHVDDPIMDLVTRTLTGMGHNTVRPAGLGRLEHHMDMLKRYILNVLNNNEDMFNKASAELDNIEDTDELEEKLIRLLGPERFGLCGVQLLHYKNFSYNVRQGK